MVNTKSVLSGFYKHLFCKDSIGIFIITYDFKDIPTPSYMFRLWFRGVYIMQ